MVFPVVPGKRQAPLRGHEPQAKTLELAETRPVGPDGIVVLT